MKLEKRFDLCPARSFVIFWGCQWVGVTSVDRYFYTLRVCVKYGVYFAIKLQVFYWIDHTKIKLNMDINIADKNYYLFQI